MNHYIILFVLLPLLFNSYPTNGFIAYDCGAGNTNITHLSLNEIGDCDIPQLTTNSTSTYFQLLQLAQYKETHVTQCKVEIHRIIYYCGMNSHVSVVEHGALEYLLDISREQCMLMHHHGSLKISNTIIDGLKSNSTRSYPLTLAGIIRNDASCSGMSYIDPFGTWSGVVVQAVVKITLRDYIGNIDLDRNRIHLATGIVCDFKQGNCLDHEGGYAYWESLPVDSCKFNRYTVLYEGPGTRTIDTSSKYPEEVYTATTNDITFALAKEKSFQLCGFSLIQTEHPKLLILEGNKGSFFATQGRIGTKDLDIFAYVNSKFIYVEKHIRNQVKELFRDVVLQRCLLEQQVLKNALSIATQMPDQFAYDFMKGPGYMAVVAGEVIHLIKCIPVEVRIRRTKDCYQELPISQGNNSYFLTPRTHIIKSDGMQISCNSILPPMYQIGSHWYKLLPDAAQTQDPNVMKPLNKPTWGYQSPEKLTTSGVYTPEDLDRLRRDVMFPANRPAILNVVARKLSGQEANVDGVFIGGLLNTDMIADVASSTWTNMWGSLTQYGLYSAGIIMIILILKLSKLILDTVKRCKKSGVDPCQNGVII